MKQLIILFVLLALSVRADAIKHRFLVADESGHQLVHINEKDPSANWKVPIKEKHAWDIQLIGNDQVAVTTPTGYHVINIMSGTLVDTVTLDGVANIWSVRLMSDGHRMVIGTGAEGSLYAVELDGGHHILRRSEVPGVSGMRFGRITAEGHALAVPGDELIEWDLDGKIIARFKLPIEHFKGKKLMSFMALKDECGNYWVADGYGATTVKLDAAGTVLQRIVGPEWRHFTGGFQRLPNGNIVQTNWAGHQFKKAVAGKQLMEFNPAGELVWTYHDPVYFGCPVGVIVLDDLNTATGAGDATSLLRNFQ